MKDKETVETTIPYNNHTIWIQSCVKLHAAIAHIMPNILLILLHEVAQTTILAGNRHQEDEENPPKLPFLNFSIRRL